jgi:adenosylcobinamide amidohydrolase
MITEPDGGTAPLLRIALPAGSIALSSAVVGGGLGRRTEVANLTVSSSFAGDPVAWLATCGVVGDGVVGMMTAVDVREATAATETAVEVVATVGVGWPTYAAAPDGASTRWAPGTINVVAYVPVRLSDSALVNAVITATEAKSQALADAAVPGTGTATDVVCIACPAEPPSGTEPEPYCGPRSTWGAPLARAVHAAVTAGLRP